MKSTIETEPELRRVITTQIARHFLDHLQRECAKPDELTEVVRAYGRTSKDINAELLTEARRAFPDATREPAPEHNLFPRWVELNKPHPFPLTYETFVFETYNTLFFARLLHLRDGSEQRATEFRNTVRQSFAEYDPESKGFAPSFFVRQENNMRELLREVVLAIPDIDHDAAWEIVLGQSTEYQELVDRYFKEVVDNALEEARVANRWKDIVISIIAHDLRSPLNGIRLSAQMLQQEAIAQLERQDAEIVNAIADSAQNASGLLEDVIQWIRASEGRAGVTMEPVELRSVLSEISSLEATGGQTPLRIDAPDSVFAQTDRRIVATILRNLISNARKHGAETEPPVVRVRPGETEIQVDVQDDGPGMPEGIREVLNADGDIRDAPEEGLGKGQRPGIGLGLAKRLSAEIGARLQFEAGATGGTVARLVLSA